MRERNVGDLAKSFAPLAGPQARLLILGSMPGRESLAQARYYAHPRNAFWPIMGELLGFEPGQAYPARLSALADAGIALWDVLQQCERPGSLDSNIRAPSVIANDFADLYRHCPQIQAVCFNGSAAERLYRRHVVPTLAAPACALPLLRLPSTSPAHAAVTADAKAAAWRDAIVPYLRDASG